MSNKMVSAFLRHYSSKYGNFKDSLILKVYGGNGGNGKCSFESSLQTPKGKPNGANGGKGGRIIIRVDPSLSSLCNIPSTLRAENGAHGRINDMQGRNGTDLILKVPLGTQVNEVEEIETWSDGSEIETWSDGTKIAYEAEEYYPDEEEDEEEEIMENGNWNNRRDLDFPTHLKTVDLDSVDHELIVAYGGAGGLGNRSLNTGMEQCELGFSGERRKIKLSMQTIADIGLVGFPNAGKSSLLTKISNATPEVASYPFTTIRPYIGEIEFKDYNLRVTDIPGIIKDAHLNKGLGHSFLKHIIKSRIIALVVDIGSENPMEEIDILMDELEAYQKGLSAKCKMIISNKMDLEDSFKKYNKLLQNEYKLPIYPISCKYDAGISELINQFDLLLPRAGCPKK